MKGKEEKKRFPTECRVPENSRREKNVYLNEQYKEIEKNNRKEKTTELFKKNGDIKATFHVRMSMIKDRNGKDLREAGEIKKRLQEYIEELYEKDLNDLDNQDSVVTHLNSDILECEVKWV